MLFKKWSLWVGVFLIVVVVPLAVASGLLKQVKPNELGELSRGRYKLMSMIAGCEMDNKCMQVTLTEVLKKDPHPVYENYLYQLNNNKDQIEYEQVHCNTPALRAYRRELSSCLAATLKEIDPNIGINMAAKTKVQDKLNSCITGKIESLGKAGNLYAQAALMNNALKNKDMGTFEYWYNAIQIQRTRLEFASYRECEVPLQMFELFDPKPVVPSSSDKQG